MKLALYYYSFTERFGGEIPCPEEAVVTRITHYIFLHTFPYSRLNQSSKY